MIHFDSDKTGSPLSFIEFKICSPPSGQYNDEIISHPFL